MSVLAPLRTGLRLCVPPLLLATAAGPALAAWPTSSSVSVPIVTTPEAQERPRACSDGAGGAYIVWNDRRDYATTRLDVYAQRLSMDGDVMWTTDGVVVANATMDQGDVVVAPDGQGGLFAAWLDGRLGTSSLFAQRMDADGNALWTPGGITAVADVGTPTGLRHAVCPDGAGGMFLVWKQATGPNVRVSVQRFTAGGAPAWTSPVTPGNVGDPTNTIDCSIAADGAGGCVVAWRRADGVRAQRLDGDGIPQWALNGVVVSSSGAALFPRIIGDGSGGAWVSWDESLQQRLSHVSPAGVPTAPWAPFGSTSLYSGELAAADSGGALLVAYTPDNLYVHVQRVASDDLARWGPNGLRVDLDGQPAPTSLLGGEAALRILADGHGGAYVCANAAGNVGAQRVSSDGTPLWPPYVSPTGFHLQLSADPNDGWIGLVPTPGGAIVTWLEYPSYPVNGDVRAKRVDVSAAIGGPTMEVASIEDTPDDDGATIRVSWNACSWDVGGPPGVEAYRLLRAPGGTDDWEFADSLDAIGAEGYVADVPAYQRSDNYESWYTKLRIEALRAGQVVIAVTDSGLAFENTPPESPPYAIADVSVSGDEVTVHWGASPSPDVDVYRLDRFCIEGPHGMPAARILRSGPRVPNPAAVEDLCNVAYVADTTFTWSWDPEDPEQYYVTAVDSSGNESSPPTAAVPGPVDVRGGVSTATAFHRAFPNPAPRGAATTLRFTLGAATDVRLAVFDLQGRRVLTLVETRLAAGDHSAAWDGRSESGLATGPGLYFARLEVGPLVMRRSLLRQ